MNHTSIAARRTPRATALAPLRWAAIGALLLSTAALVAMAGEIDDGGPKALVVGINRSMAREIQAGGEALLADETRRIALVERALTGHTDFGYMAQLVLGKGWQGATADQRARFVEQFRSLLLWTFSHQVAEHVNADTLFSEPRTNAVGSHALVRSQVSPASGQTKQVDYKLHASDGQWKLFDVAVDGISIVSLYRGSFSSEVARGGLEHLIAQLVARNAKLKGT